LGRKGALRRISVENRVDISGGEDGLVAVAVEAVVGVRGTGHDAAAVVVAGNVAVVARCAVFGIETIAAWIVHDLGVVACTKLAVAVAAVAAVAVSVVVVAAVVAAVACGLAFDVVAGVFVVVAGDLRLLWLGGRARIALTCASDFFLLCVVIWFGFCGF